MIMRVRAAAGHSFMIIGSKPDSAMLQKKYDYVEDGKALAYLLYSNLPGITLEEMTKTLNELRDVQMSEASFEALNSECKQLAKDREIL